MKDLLEFILEGVVGKGNFEIKEIEEEGGRVNFSITVSSDLAGIIIGKGGKTIKAIRNILRVKATLEGRGVYVSLA